MKPGEVITLEREIELNKGRKTTTIKVVNKGDRPIQVGSHFHFFEINKLIAFAREEAYGMRLDIPSGTSVRFEPGETKTVHLVEIAGNKRVFGLNNLTDTQANEQTLKAAMNKAEMNGFVL